jgi:hypothetical protein
MARFLSGNGNDNAFIQQASGKTRGSDALFVEKNEIHCSHNTESCPKIIPCELLFHVKNGERDEYRKSDDFLKNFELWQSHDVEPNPVGRNLKQVLEKSDSPTDEYGKEPRPDIPLFQVGVPSKSHERVGQYQQDNRVEIGHHGFMQQNVL